MKSLDASEDPRNPFDSPIEKPKKPPPKAEYVSSKVSLDGLVFQKIIKQIPGLTPIRPAQVTHLGQPMARPYVLGQPVPIASAQFSSGYVQPPCRRTFPIRLEKSKV